MNIETNQRHKNFPQQIKFKATFCTRGWIGWYWDSGTQRNKLHTCLRKPDHHKKCRCACGAKRAKP